MLPCSVCGRVPTEEEPNDPHHPRGWAFGSGGSLKAPDRMAFPLCHQHHLEFHQGQQTWESRYGPQAEHVERTQAILRMSDYELAHLG